MSLKYGYESIVSTKEQKAAGKIIMLTKALIILRMSLKLGLVVWSITRFVR